MRALAFGILLVTSAACGPRGPSTDSKSNWLMECETERDCSEGLSCICGVCTMACTGAPACDRAGAAASCIDPVQAGLPLACAMPFDGVDTRVCLASCSTSAECSERQVCSMGSCISTAAAIIQAEPDGGLGSIGVGGQNGVEGAAGSGAASPESVSDAASALPFDGGLWPPIPDAAAMTAADGGGSIDGSVTCGLMGTCCGMGATCVEGLVCHIDHTCEQPGVADGDGVATLARPIPSEAGLFAANDEFVFGTGALFPGPGMLLRWPVSGGPAEPMTADPIDFGEQPRVLIDGAFVYFLAVEGPQAVEQVATLYRLPIDEPDATPESYGRVGGEPVQDDLFLYFSGPEHDSVIRVRKGAPEERQTVYVAPSGDESVSRIALNSSTVFVLEKRGAADSSTFVVHAVDKTTLAQRPDVLERPTALYPYVFATDAYVIFSAGSEIERTDLESGETLRWLVGDRPGLVTLLRQFGDTLYVASTVIGDPSKALLQTFDVPSGVLSEPTLVMAGSVKSIVLVPAATFALVTEGAGEDWVLLRVDRL